MVLAPEAQFEKVVYDRPESLTSTPTHYCPGCTHGVAHRLVAEVLDEMGVRETTIGVNSEDTKVRENGSNISSGRKKGFYKLNSSGKLEVRSLLQE